MAHHKTLAVALSLLLAASVMACGGGVDIHEINGELVAISLTPANLTVAKNSTYQFIATGIYSNNTTNDLTDSVSWEISNADLTAGSSSPSVVSYAPSSQGRITFTEPGKKTVKAKWNSFSGSATVTVTAATLLSIAVTPANPSLARGTSHQLTATGTYSDNTTQDLTASAAWSSTNTNIATVGDSAGAKGLVVSAGVGSTTVVAMFGSTSGSTVLTVTPATLVSLSVTPVNPSIARGTSRQFMATGTYSDNSVQDLTAASSWTSSDTAVATVSNTAGSQGSAVAREVGTTSISATSGGISGSTMLTVTPATLASISVAPAAASIARGTNRQFTATGNYSDTTTQDLTGLAVWYSSNTGVATISNAAGSKGMASSVTTGSTVVTAASGSISGTANLTITPATLVSITVTPVNPSLANGISRQFTATGTYSDTTTQDLTASATWSSSNAAIASISNAAGSKGSASALAAGTATITAASEALSGSTTLTVTAATLVSLRITPANPSAPQGASQQFTATGTYSDASTESLTASVAWSSSAPGVASISNAAGSQGLATAIAPGTTTVTAITGSVSSTTAFTVTATALGTATLAWDAPTTNADGTPLTDLAGYRIYYGAAPGNYSNSIDAGNVTTWTITSLSSGTYYFVVTAYDLSGNESSYSNEISKTIL